MVKTPEEYFAAQSFAAPGAGKAIPGDSLTAAERDFVAKYLGTDALAGLPDMAAVASSAAVGLPLSGASLSGGNATGQGQPRPLSIKAGLQALPMVQMVSFYVQGQLFLLPVALIHEVLRHLPLVRLPKAPPYMAGVINLRGKVTPLLYLDALLTLDGHGAYTKQHFIVICETEELQLGLIIDKVHSMYHVPQDAIHWNAEVQLGDSAELLYGIADISGRICGIVAPELIVRKVQGL